MKELPPFGFCRCGCGEKTEIATRTNFARGAIRGEPQRYKQGHGAHPRKADSTRARRRNVSEAARERNRRLQVDRDRAKYERARMRKAEEERRARRRSLERSAAPFIALYRTEKQRHTGNVDRLIQEAKLELARVEAANKRVHRGGRPRKVVAHG